MVVPYQEEVDPSSHPNLEVDHPFLDHRLEEVLLPYPEVDPYLDQWLAKAGVLVDGHP